MAIVAGVQAPKPVPADQWCVTRKDLRILRHQVREAIEAGTVQPTARDPFDPADDAIGPSVYTVTDQLVKPLTAKAGGTSWALLQHPDGLKCDLFVTHAWAEGTFEIIDKVLASWPRKAKNAWICFLANPQNSDIAALVAKPRGSPFALALQSASHVMVVPNARCSIYSRLWCAYEAFLAYEWDKFIFMATPDVRPHYWRALLASLVSALAGAAAAQLWRWLMLVSSSVELVVMWSCSMLMLAIAVVALRVPDARRRLCNRLGSFLAAHLLAVHNFPDDGEELHHVLNIIFSMIVLYHFAAEKDRVKSASLRVATEELALGYTGSIGDAACSVAADEAAIRAEIGATTEEVNKTIQVLLRVGMSTPVLRRAADLGVDMSGLAAKETSFVTTFGLGEVVIFAYEAAVADDQRLLRALCLAVLMLLCGFFAFVSVAGHDRRVFAARLVEVTSISIVLPVTVVSMCFWDYLKASLLCSALSIWQWLLCLLLPLVGVEKVATVPYVGPWMAQLMVGYAPRSCYFGAGLGWGPLLLRPLSSLRCGRPRWKDRRPPTPASTSASPWRWPARRGAPKPAEAPGPVALASDAELGQSSPG